MSTLSKRINSLSESATLKMTKLGRELASKGVNIISLSVGEPDFNTPDHVKNAAKDALDANYTRHSPVPGYPDLRQAIVKKLKEENNLDYDISQIVVSTGAKQSLSNVILTLIDPDDEVLFQHHTGFLIRKWLHLLKVSRFLLIPIWKATSRLL